LRLRLRRCVHGRLRDELCGRGIGALGLLGEDHQATVVDHVLDRSTEVIDPEGGTEHGRHAEAMRVGGDAVVDLEQGGQDRGVVGLA